MFGKLGQENDKMGKIGRKNCIRTREQVLLRLDAAATPPRTAELLLTTVGIVLECKSIDELYIEGLIRSSSSC